MMSRSSSLRTSTRRHRAGRAWLPLALVLSPLALSAPGAGAQERYEPSWLSLAQHEVPEWLQDAKFGIYAHWGVYSVPAFGNEWYAKHMYNPEHPIYEHHVRTYGDPAEFGYKELIPRFRAEHYDPREWADLIERSGARFAGIAVVHHDGFLLWDSEVNRWNAADMGPKRDLYGELVEALRAEGLKTIATFHHIRTFNWYLPGSGGLADMEDPAKAEAARAKGYDLFDPAYADLYWNQYTGRFEDFVAEWNAKVREVIDNYRPDVLWFDGGHFHEPGAEQTLKELLAYYHNRGLDWGKPVEVLNKLPSNMKFNFPPTYGMLTFEEGRDRPEFVGRPWIDDMRIGTQAWGYVEGQEYKSPNEIVDGLIDRVSRGGGLLISLSPKADGTIPEGQKTALLGTGEWLRQNGEAIYGTRPWIVHAEGPAYRLVEQPTEKWIFTDADARDIRFTRRGNTLYVIALGWPDDRRLVVRNLGSDDPISSGGIERISLLGSPEPVQWDQTPEGLVLRLPARKPNELAYAFRIDVRGDLVQ